MKFSPLSFHPTHQILIPFAEAQWCIWRQLSYLPPPLSLDSMISYILFQLGISRELHFCKFCGKEELDKGNVWIGALTKRHVCKIQMLPILRRHLANELAHNYELVSQYKCCTCCLLPRQIGKQRGWELESVGDVTGGRKERGCWNKGYLIENTEFIVVEGTGLKENRILLVSIFTELLMLRLALSRRGSLRIRGPKIPELSLRSFCSLSQSNYFIMGCKLFGEHIELNSQTHKFCSMFYFWNEKKEIFVSGFSLLNWW